MGGPESAYEVTSRARKSLAYWLDDDARFKVHFGGFVRDAWSPIQVGLYVESRERRDEWLHRVQAADSAGGLPVGTKVRTSGRTTIEALKDFDWSTPADLDDDLLREVVNTVLKFEAALGQPMSPKRNSI